MASPEVLKNSGRNCPETPEQMNLVELMCEFVEAMNPGLVLSKKPQILKDRDLTGELKDIWSAVQNFRDKEKAGVSDIVVYTEFGPESSSASSPPPLRATPMDFPVATDLVDAPLNSEEKISSNGHNELEPELDTKQKSCAIEDSNIDSNHHESEVVCKREEDKSADVMIEKLSLSDNASSKKSCKSSNNLSNENESSEKLVKAQNQKNKESHHFFPKFLTSNKDKDTKEKEKEKDKNHDEQQPPQSEAKVKTKKSLNFFRRNKTSSSSISNNSPTHTATSNQQKTEGD